MLTKLFLYLDSAGVPSEEVLRAPLGGQVGEVAGVLRDLFKEMKVKRPYSGGGNQCARDKSPLYSTSCLPGWRFRPRWSQAGIRGCCRPRKSPRTLNGSGKLCFFYKKYTFFVSSRCSPAFSPQMTGGALPPGLVTEKVSVRHWVEVVAACISEKHYSNVQSPKSNYLIILYQSVGGGCWLPVEYVYPLGGVGGGAGDGERGQVQTELENGFF